MVNEFRFSSTLEEGQIKVANAIITKKDSRQSNTATFDLATDTSLALGQESKLYNTDNTHVFSGYIESIKDNMGLQSVLLSDYSIQFTQLRLNEVYSGQTIEYIVNDIITNHTDLTNLSTVVTGITLDKIVFKDELIIDCLNKLLDLINGGYVVDKLKNFTMEVKASDTSALSLSLGEDAIIEAWKSDNTKRAESVIVKGKTIDQRTFETLSGTGTVFNTTYKPRNIEISGMQQTTSTIDGDYSVDVENSEITFNASQTNPTVSYTYQSQIKVEFGAGKTIQLVKNYIETTFEALTLAKKYYGRFSDGVQSSKWRKNNANIDSINPGDQIYVVDTKNGMTGFYLINSVKFKLPSIMDISLGESEDDLFDWQKETAIRVQELEKKDVNNDFITKYEYIVNGLKVKINVTIPRFQQRTVGGGYFYLNHPTQGMLNSTYLVSSGDSSMGAWEDIN